MFTRSQKPLSNSHTLKGGCEARTVDSYRADSVFMTATPCNIGNLELWELKNMIANAMRQL